MSSKLRVLSFQFLLHSLSVIDCCWLTDVSLEILQTSRQTGDRCFGNASSSSVSREGTFGFLSHRRDARGEPERRKPTGEAANRERTNEYPGQQVYPARRTNKYMSSLAISMDSGLYLLRD